MESGGGDAGAYHRNEAISAVQDEDQFFGDDDDFDDLYNDVNVGEGFHQALHRNEDQSAPAAAPPPPPPPPVFPPATAVNQTEKAQISAPDLKPERPVAPPVLPPLQQLPPAPPSYPVNLPRPDFVPQPTRPADGLAGFAGDARHGGGPIALTAGNMNGGGATDGGAGGTTLFVGDLHWWTTDADLEAELSKYGQVKEVKFFDEKASGKSKGYCQVDFYDPMATTACKDGMNGHLFNGRPCVVAFASPFSVRRMGEQQVKNHQQAMAAQSSTTMAQKGGRPGGGVSGGGTQSGGNYGRGGSGGIGGGGSGGSGVLGAGGGASSGGPGGNWGRGGMGNRGPMGNMRNRMGPGGGRAGIMANGGMVAPPPPVLHPGAMLNQGFDPTGYGAAAMGRMGAGFGAFPPGPMTAPFQGLMPSVPPFVAPHVNPAFFGRGGMGPGVGMWPDPSLGGGWGGEEQSSYDDATSDQQYGEGSHGKERGPGERERSGASERRRERESEIAPSQDWQDRRHRDDREAGRDRDRERDWEREKDRERDREREREREREKERERERERERDRDRDRDRERERERERERDRDRHRDDNRDRHNDYYRHRDRDQDRGGGGGGDDWDRSHTSRGQSKSREADHSKRRRTSAE